MEQKIVKVFVYGTLMRGGIYHYLIEPLLHSAYKGWIYGRLYDLPYGYPAVVHGKGRVHGEVLELLQPERALIVMDKIEGYQESGKYNLYDRQLTRVYTKRGIKSAHVYYWARPEELKALGRLEPSGRWKPRQE